MYLCLPRISVTMKFIGDISIAERVKLWNAIVGNVNEIEITEKDIVARQAASHSAFHRALQALHGLFPCGRQGTLR